MMKPVRPTGVSLLAILYILVGVLALLGGVLLIGVGGSGVLNTAGYGYLSGVATGIGGVVAVIGVIGILIGWGMWTGRGWARLIAIIFSIIGVLGGVISLALGSVTSILGLIIDILILWYLFRPHVKAYFGGAPVQPSPVSQPSPPTV